MSFIKRLFSKESQAVAAVKPSRPEEIPNYGTEAVKGQDIETLPWMIVAKKYLGLTEIPGTKSNSIISKWLQLVRQRPDDSIAWCAAAVNGILAEAGYEGSGKANARSFLNVGKALNTFSPGAIVVLWRVSPSAWQGHVGFAIKLSPDSKRVLIRGGNQGDAFNDTWYSTSQVLGYRWPTPKAK